MNPFVSSFLHFLEGPIESALMLVDQSDFDSVHAVIVEFSSISPYHEGTILLVAVSEVALSHGVVLGLCSGLLLQAFLLVLKLFTFRDFLLQHGPSGLEFVLGISELDGIETLFEQPLSPDSLDV